MELGVAAGHAAAVVEAVAAFRAVVAASGETAASDVIAALRGGDDRCGNRSLGGRPLSVRWPQLVRRSPPMG